LKKIPTVWEKISETVGGDFLDSHCTRWCQSKSYV